MIKRNNLLRTSAVWLLAGLLLSNPALAQQAGGTPPVNADPADINPKVAQGEIPKPAPTPAAGITGPLAGLAQPLADKGVTLHALALNLFEANPSVGINTGNSTNSLYVYVGADADLGTLAGLGGISLHFENVFFPLTRNLNIAGQIGDSTLGYQPAYTPRGTRLSRATVEIKGAKGAFDLEVGITHPAYYYAQFNCNAIASCFQGVLFVNSGYTSYSFAVPGINASFKASDIYVQGGVFAVESGANARTGYQPFSFDYAGTLVMGEIGIKKSFANTVYPYALSLTGYSSSAPHTEFFPDRTTSNKKGTSGFVLQGDKVIWRADGGSNAGAASPTALKLYTSVGISTDSTTPIQSDVFAGATLLSPVAGRSDRVGVQIDWRRLSSSYTRYLTASNQAAGGPGPLSPYKQSTFILQANAHVQMPLGIAVEPIVEYAINPNSFYNPSSRVKARDGVYVAVNLVVPIGTILGLQH